jgi:hypothetical protein
MIVHFKWSYIVTCDIIGSCHMAYQLNFGILFENTNLLTKVTYLIIYLLTLNTQVGR